MSIFTCILSLFVIADNEFWTFFSRIAPLCPFSAPALAVSSIRWLEYAISNNSDLQTVKNIFKTFSTMSKAHRSPLTMTGFYLKKFSCFSNKIKGNIDKCTILAITTLGKTQRMLRMVFGNISFKRGS